MTAQLAMLNGMEVVAILAVCLVLFGAKKLPELAQGLGKGLREFKKAANDLSEEAMNMATTESLPPPKPTAALPESTSAAQHHEDAVHSSSHASDPYHTTDSRATDAAHSPTPPAAVSTEAHPKAP